MSEKREYSKEIAKVIKDFLVKDDWKFDFDEEEGLFSFGISVSGKVKSLDVRMRVFDDAFNVTVRADSVTADIENHDELAVLNEYIVRVNDDLSFSHFSLDYEDGDIYLWHFRDCEDDIPSEAVVKNAIYHSCVSFEEFAPGFLQILYGDTDAKTAFEKSVEEFEKKD